MINYDKFYKDIGVRKLRHLVNLKPLQAKDFFYPKDSMVFWYVHSDVPNIMTKGSTGISNTKKPLVNVISEYTEETIGSYRTIAKTNASFISKNKKEERGFAYIKPKTKEIKIPSNKELIFHYGFLSSNHKYVSHPLSSYYKWYNGFKTMLSHVVGTYSGNNRHKFIMMKLPSSIFKIEEYFKYETVINRQMLEVFYNYRFLSLRELLLYMNPVTRKDSLFSVLSDRDIETTDIVFVNESKITVINIYTLLSMVSDNIEKTAITKYNFKTILKLMLVFVTNMYEKPPVTIDTIINQDTIVENDIHSSIGDVTIDKNNVVLDDYLDEEDVQKEDSDIEEAVEIITDITTVDESDIDYENLDKEETILKHTEELKSKKIVTNNTLNRVKEILTEQKRMKSPYVNDNIKLSDALRYSKEDMVIDEDKIATPDTVSVLDKSYNKDTLTVMKESYLKKVYKKDVLNVIYGLQGKENVIEAHTIEDNSNILGSTETHTIKIKNITGTSNTVRVILPKVNTDGTIMMSGNKYIMRSQKSDVPIRKISGTKVGLTTYYGKLFITKSTFKKDDAGFWFKKQLLNLYTEEQTVKDIIFLPCTNVDIKIPRDYGIIARYTKSFKYKNMVFNFSHNDAIKEIKDKKLITLLESKHIICGLTTSKDPIVMDFNNDIFIYKDNKFNIVSDVYTLLNIDKELEPIEFSNVKIMKSNVPVCIMLCYYVGLDKLLTRMNAKYYKLESNKRPESKLGKMIFKLNDVQYVIDRDYGVIDMMFGGLLSVNRKLKTLPSSVFNNRNKFSAVFTLLEMPLLYVNEVKLMEDMYIDPISKDVLESMSEPVVFIKLLIRASELLLEDDYAHPNSVSNVYYKGYERIPGLLYKELITAIKTKNNKSHFSKAKLELNPYSVIGKINEDSTVVLVDDINPIASLKQKEDTTALGFGGRTEETMNKASRRFHYSEVGITSEGGKDSGSVGVTSYLTANPSFSNIRGVTKDLDMSKHGMNDILTTSALLAPFSTNDDTKRTKS